MSDGDGYAPSAVDVKIDCYSGGESDFMDWSQSLRGRLLAPFLGRLAAVGIRANQLTYLSLLAGLLFCPFFLFGLKPVAFGLLMLHVLLDGLDGPLARYRGHASNRGSFTDTAVDQLVVTASALTMMHAGYAGIWCGGLYVFFYAVVVGFAFARNALAAPYSWLFRPRFIVYAWFVVEVYWWPGSLEWVLWGAGGVLALKALTGFLTIRRKI
jgi:phosphatidylglycerophosphate synthase